MISIDHSHLYGKYQRTILVELGVDANDQFCFAYIRHSGKGENKKVACILGFVHGLHSAKVAQRTDLCMILDWHKGMNKVIADEYLGRDPNMHNIDSMCVFLPLTSFQAPW